MPETKGRRTTSATRKVRLDALLEAAVDVAREAAETENGGEN